jgi:hypothetical protein
MEVNEFKGGWYCSTLISGQFFSSNHSQSCSCTLCIVSKKYQNQKPNIPAFFMNPLYKCVIVNVMELSGHYKYVVLPVNIDRDRLKTCQLIFSIDFIEI